ncbi:MAG: hypothetical protein JO127_08640 [Caulobacteraceae bacterium]|nr:hypothetical protein [Caulobacteraceae bacterium]
MLYSVRKSRLPQTWRWRVHEDGGRVASGFAFTKAAAKKAAIMAARRARRRLQRTRRGESEPLEQGEPRWTPSPGPA